MQENSFYISRLKVHNFKSFEDLDVELGRFNVIIGQNASGKSNFKNIFSFLKDIVDQGLENAISLHGESEFIRKFTSTNSDLSIEVHFSIDTPVSFRRFITKRPRDQEGIFIDTIVYKFSLQFSKNRSHKITDEDLTFCGFFKESQNSEKIMGSMSFLRKKNTVSFNHGFPNLPDKILKHYVSHMKSSFIDTYLFLESKLFTHMIPEWHIFLSNMGIYDFDPKSLKSTSSARVYPKLSYSGDNLSYILDGIKHDPRALDQLNIHLQDMLPFLKTISTERMADGSIQFSLEEIFNSKNLPSLFASDGTANILGLLVCLFLQNNKLSFIEEPERNIHSGLLSHIVELMNDASVSNQVFITTHSADLLDQIPHHNVLMVVRSGDGRSDVIKAQNHDIIRDFKGVMSTGQLMNQNMLE